MKWKKEEFYGMGDVSNSITAQEIVHKRNVVYGCGVGGAFGVILEEGGKPRNADGIR